MLTFASDAAPVTVKKLPSVNEFTPGAPVGNPIDLLKVLGMVDAHSGNFQAQQNVIRAEYFANAAANKPDLKKREKDQYQMARNVLIGMRTFGLYDHDTHSLTDAGREILSKPTLQTAKECFATHILLNVHGLEIVKIIAEMQKGHRQVTKVTLAEELGRNKFVTAQGGEIGTNTTDHLKLIAWLREAGVFSSKGYEIDDTRLESLCGVKKETLTAVDELNDRQKVFLQIVRRNADINGKHLLLVRDVLQACKAYAPKLFAKTDDIAKLSKALEEKGWIERDGKGGKGNSGRVIATDQLTNTDPSLLGIQTLTGIPSEIRQKLQIPLDTIYDEIDYGDTGTKGLALETLAVRIVYELGLSPIRFRERGSDNQGAEVDLIAEGSNLHFHRWMVQCKCTKIVPVSALAKEIGMAVLYKAQVVLLITTGSFTETVSLHARELAETTNLQAILIDRRALNAYKSKGLPALLEHFEVAAEIVASWKTRQLNLRD